MGISITNCLSRSFCLPDSDQLPPAREHKFARRLKKRPPRAGISTNTTFRNHERRNTTSIRKDVNSLEYVEHHAQPVDDRRWRASEVWDTRLGHSQALIHEQEGGEDTVLSESASNLDGWQGPNRRRYGNAIGEFRNGDIPRELLPVSALEETLVTEMPFTCPICPPRKSNSIAKAYTNDPGVWESQYHRTRSTTPRPPPPYNDIDALPFLATVDECNYSTPSTPQTCSSALSANTDADVISLLSDSSDTTAASSSLSSSDLASLSAVATATIAPRYPSCWYANTPPLRAASRYQQPTTLRTHLSRASSNPLPSSTSPAVTFEGITSRAATVAVPTALPPCDRGPAPTPSQQYPHQQHYPHQHPHQLQQHPSHQPLQQQQQQQQRSASFRTTLRRRASSAASDVAVQARGFGRRVVDGLVGLVVPREEALVVGVVKRRASDRWVIDSECGSLSDDGLRAGLKEGWGIEYETGWGNI